MEPDQIVLVEESFEQLLPIADTAADLFYARLFALDPSLRSMFADDLGAQRQKLMTILNTSVQGLWRLEDLVPVLQQLGARHVSYGVRPEHYDLVEQALISMLAQSLHRSFTPEVEAAWREAYAFIATTMQTEAG